MQRVHALKKLVSKFDDGPSIAVKALLLVWQSNQFPMLCKVNHKQALLLSQNKLIEGLASWLMQRPFLDAAFWLSSAYSIWVGDDVRSEKSLFFTPPILAERLIDDLVEQGASLIDDVWMDPACGGGAFLVPVAVKMIDAMIQRGMSDQQIVAQVSKNLVGVDSDETLAYLSTQFLRMALYRNFEGLADKPRFHIFVGDGLSRRSYRGKKANVIICNPPYRKMKSVEVNEYVHQYSDVIEGQPNIYGLFICQCLRLGVDDSLVGLLTPTSYLSGQYFSKLRQFILEQSEVYQLDLIDDRVGVFIGVSQGAVLSLFRRRAKRSNSASRLTKVFALSKKGNFSSIGTCKLGSGKRSWSIPREQGDQELIKLAIKSPYRLADYGYIARVGTYVDYRDKRTTYIKRPKRDDMQTVFPLIWSSDITTKGKLIHGRTSEKDGHCIFIDMGCSEHRAIIRCPAIALQRVTSPDQDRRLICAPIDDDFMRLHRGVVGENHVIFLVAIEGEAKFNPTQLCSILTSEPIDRLFRSISGAVNVSVSEINQLMLPNPDLLSKNLEINKSIKDAVIKSFERKR